MARERPIKVEKGIHPTEKLILRFIESLNNFESDAWEDFVYDWNVRGLSKKEMCEWYFSDANGEVSKAQANLGSKIINYLVHVDLKDERLQKYSGVLIERKTRERISLPLEVERVIKRLRNKEDVQTIDIVEYIYNEYKDKFKEKFEVEYDLDKEMIYMNIKYYISHGEMKARQSIYKDDFMRRLVELYKGDKANYQTTVDTLKSEFPDVNIDLNINKVRGIYFRNKDKY